MPLVLLQLLKVQTVIILSYFLGSLEKENQEFGEYNIAAINTVMKSGISFSDIHNGIFLLASA